MRGREAGPPRPRTECAAVSSPRCSPRLVGCWRSCNIGPPSSAKYVNVLYAVADESARLGPIRRLRRVGPYFGRQCRLGYVATYRASRMVGGTGDLSADTVWAASHLTMLLGWRYEAATCSEVVI
ncbi:hypothetical protein BHE74_00024165 [Ensete ventricosum]|nr:hypothetical protein BHE74_00024165 [Ensete ventricosum]